MIAFREFETTTGGRLDVLDVTPEVERAVLDAGVETGSVLVFSPHTTCCVLVTAPGQAMVKAMWETMEAIAPVGAYYAHDDLEIRTENLVEDEPANAPAHIVHAFMGKSSECVPVHDGRLVLGDRQRILFVELDSARRRRYFVQVLGT